MKRPGSGASCILGHVLLILAKTRFQRPVVVKMISSDEETVAFPRLEHDEIALVLMQQLIAPLAPCGASLPDIYAAAGVARVIAGLASAVILDERPRPPYTLAASYVGVSRLGAVALLAIVAAG